MYIVRDIFQLKFGHYRDAKLLIDEMIKMDMLDKAVSNRILSDFTGDSYRLIFEVGFTTLADYESSLTGGMGKPEWQSWYIRFKEHVVSSYREILKQVV
jgi:hypothetical protein